MTDQVRITSIKSIFMVICCFIICLLSLFVTTSSFVPSARAEVQRERVAVLSLRNRISMSREETDYLTSLVRRIASRQLGHTFLIMTQENINVLLPPDTNLEECVSECQVETGRLIGARYLITGEVLRFGSSLRLTLRLHDTKSGQLISSEVAKGKTVEGLEEPAERSVQSLIARVVKSSEEPLARESAIIIGSSNSPQRSHNQGTSRSSSARRARSYPKKSRQERLRERARLAHQEREAKRRARIDRRKARQRAQVEQARKKQTNEDAGNGATLFNREFYFAISDATCDELNGSDCSSQGLENALSFSTAFRYYFSNRESAKRWGWRSGVELKYSHNALSSTMPISSSDELDLNYSVNHLSLAYVFAYDASWLQMSTHVGLGLMSGRYSFFVEAEQDFPELIEYQFDQELGINFGASAGIRFSQRWMVSAFTEIIAPTSEVQLCDQLSDQGCTQGAIPQLSQTGLRISLTL